MSSNTPPVVLLTEDFSIIALTLTDELEEAGFAVAGPFASCCDAEEWLRTGSPDCAVLDVRLKDGDCTALATELARRNIPSVVLSGFQPQTSPVQIPATVWLDKPAAPDALVSTIRDLIAPAPPSARMLPEGLAQNQVGPPD